MTQAKNMKQDFSTLIPKASIDLVKYSAKDLINRLGKDIISNVVLSILSGNNIRNLTEGLTQRRLLLMNSALFMTYLKALKSYNNFTKNLSSIIQGELKGKKLSKNEERYLYWFLGLTSKGLDNVARGTEGVSDYLSKLDKNLFEVSKEIEKQYGKLNISVTNNGIDYLMNWPSLLRCMLALGAQTLTIRGSLKSTYGKLFEKFVLGSVLTLLGAKYINRGDTKENKMVFWLSERNDKRESDATLLLKPGFGVRFDIGFIGKGNSEISLDKVTRFERMMERGGLQHNTTTIILIDTLGSHSRTEDMARQIGGYIVQMSGTYWVHQLVHILNEIFPFYKHPMLKMTPEQSITYLEKETQNIDLSQFLSVAEIRECE